MMKIICGWINRVPLSITGLHLLMREQWLEKHNQ